MRTAHRSSARVLIACALVAALVIAPGARPVRAGGVVGTGTPGSCTEAAFDAALSGGGTITFNCGPAPYTILITSQKSINATTTIDGGGTITLDGQDAHRLFDVGTLLTLRRIVLTRGYFNGDGGAIRNTSDGSLVLENSTIRASRATASGGAILSTGPLTITDSLLEGNVALNGGALYPRFAGARTVIINSVLRNNHATDTTDGWGGALLAWDGAPITIAGSDIDSNSARYGGGIYNFANSSVTLIGSTLRSNSASAVGGGGIYNRSILTVYDSTFSGNSANYDVNGGGGGILNLAGTAIVYDSTFIGNSATGGGGILNDHGGATLTNVTLSGNTAGSGGGINSFYSTATLMGVTLSANLAALGGGIYNANGIATLTNVTLSGNTASRNGGGIYNFNSTATLTNVTLSGNTAGIGGGGISRESGSVTVRNSLVANSPSGGDCAGAVINDGFNLASDTSCGFNQVPNVMLGPLADNGGPTLTHMPQPGSPAIDFVAAGCPPPATDQRGANRPVDGDSNGSARCDVGAVEYGAAVAVVYLPLVRK